MHSILQLIVHDLDNQKPRQSTNRSQYCSIDGQVSDIMEIECGIP